MSTFFDFNRDFTIYFYIYWYFFHILDISSSGDLPPLLHHKWDSRLIYRTEVIEVAMTWVWTGMVVVSVVFGLMNGTINEVGNAAMEGAGAALELCLSMGGILCLWSGVMAVMNRCGFTDALARLFRPVLCRLMPEACRDKETMAAVSANISCNLLGLGNAATPLGIQAARRMARGSGGIATNELCMLVVLNTASIQLLPTTVAGVRSAYGSAAPFEILPAVWLASALSVLAGIVSAKLLSRLIR